MRHACESTPRWCLQSGGKPTPEMQEYLKRRILSILLCANWVCAGTFDDHEWVSESTITQYDEEVLGRELDFENCVPCVVQWWMLWFSVPTRFHQTWENPGVKIAKYHEAVNTLVIYTHRDCACC